MALFTLSRKSGLYPECLVLKDLTLDEVYVDAVGTYGDVRKGTIQGATIAVKQLRINGSNVAKVLKVSGNISPYLYVADHIANVGLFS